MEPTISPQLKIIFDSLTVDELHKILKKIGYQSDGVDKDELISGILEIMRTNESVVSTILLSILYPPITTISGPVSWSWYKYKGVNIHIFGDRHDSNKPCTQAGSTSIVELMKTVARRAIADEEIVNVFLESPYMVRESEKRSVHDFDPSHLDDIAIEFSSCLLVEKKGCPYYPFFKMHYADIRRTKRSDINKNGVLGYLWDILNAVYYGKYTAEELIELPSYFDFSQILYELVENRRLFYDITVGSQHGKDIEDELINKLNLSSITNTYKTNTRTHKVKWQLMNINPEMSRRIELDTMINYDNTVDRIVDLVTVGLDEDKMNFDLWLARLWSAVLDLNVYMMDAYLLARMFRVMEWDKRSKLIMIYVGDIHKKRYDEFFRKHLGMKMIDGRGEDVEGSKCITNLRFSDIFGDKLFE